MALRRFSTLLMVAAFVLSIVGTALAQSIPDQVYGIKKALEEVKQASQDAGTAAPVVAEKLSRVGVRDVPTDHWAAGPIAVLVEVGFVEPDPAGQVKPDEPVGADAGVAIFAKILGIASSTDDPATAAAKAEQAGLVASRPTVDRPLSRMETAEMLAKALGITPKPFVVTPPFADADAVPRDQWGLLAALKEAGVFLGFPDGTFQPHGMLTTAQIAILIERVLGALGG